MTTFRKKVAPPVVSKPVVQAKIPEHTTPLPRPKISPPIAPVAEKAISNSIQGKSPIGGGPTVPYNPEKVEQVMKSVIGTPAAATSSGVSMAKNAIGNAIKGMPVTASVPESKPKFQQMDDTIGMGKPVTVAPPTPRTLAMPMPAKKTMGPIGLGTNATKAPMQKLGAQYLKKGGKINLDACSVSTHQKSKKSSSW